MNLDDILKTEDNQEEYTYALATIGEVSSAGVTLKFDGSASIGGKLYRCNSGVLFKAGDRVRVKKDSGSYIVEFPVGLPMARYPIPPGGSDGQVLTKDGPDDYAVKWTTPSSSGGLPTGGSTGQFLQKKSNTDFDVQWAAAAIDKFGTGSYYVEISSTGTITPNSSGGVDLGTSARTFGDLYASGTISLGGSGYTSTLGFFGTRPVRKTSVSTSASLSTLISALNSYGLV